MPIRKPKPTSPGLRFVTYADFAEITKSKPEKTLTEGLKKSGGRNANGRKTARHRGGGAKRLYRMIDFKRRKDGVPARVAAIEYDPNRSAYIALLHYVDGAKAYILAPNRLRVGMIVESGPRADITVGNALPLATCRSARIVHNVELQPGRGGQLARSAGAGVQLMAKEGDYATLRLPSGEMRMVRAECRATVGDDRQRRPPEHHHRQGRPQAPHGRAPADARHRHEPGRPPARRRRGRHAAGQPPADALGRADDRLPHPQEGQAVRPLHRPRPPPRQEGQPLMCTFVQEGAVGRGPADGAHRADELLRLQAR